MRNFFWIYLGFMFVCILVVATFTSYDKENEISKGDSIRLLITDSNEIITMSVNDYIMGVLIGEVPATYDIEALKAQAVVARTYTYHKLLNSPNSHTNSDMCDDINHCQAYKTQKYAFDAWNDDEEDSKWDKISDAVLSTSNEVILYDGYLINSFFHAHSGGRTEDVSAVWGNESIPYLKSVESNEGYDYLDRVTFTKNDFCNLVKNKYSNYNGEFDIAILDYTESNRVENLKVGNLILKGTEARVLFGLRSADFKLEFLDDTITFNTNGYGHGVGLSQEGANYMALQGADYKEIIKHYYTGVSIQIRS